MASKASVAVFLSLCLWSSAAARVLETIIVPTGQFQAGISVNTLTSGRTYLLRASGTFHVGGPGDRLADSEFADFSNPPSSVIDFSQEINPVDLGMSINGANPNWGAFENSHVYTMPFTGLGSKLSASYRDSNYGDNVGTLKLEIISVCPVEGLTMDHIPEPPYVPTELAPKMQTAVAKFQQGLLAKDLNIQPTSGYRTESYQQHFFDIAAGYQRLLDLPGIDWQLVDRRPQLFAVTPDGLDCNCEMDDVNWEIRNHLLTANTTSGRLGVNEESEHSQRLAVDFDIDIIRTRLSDDEIKALAFDSGLLWFGIFSNHAIHFEYDGYVNNSSFQSGSLDGWDVRGSGTATIIENPDVPNDFRVELSTGSPVELSQRFDVPAIPSLLEVDTQFLTDEGRVDVFVGESLVGHLESNGIETSLRKSRFVLPETQLGASLATLRFVLDGPSGAKLLLDNVNVFQLGDFDRDSDADGADFLLWQTQLGSTVPAFDEADGNGNGTVDAADLLVWRTNSGVGSGDGSQAAVPEPHSFILIAIGVVATCVTVRRLGPLS